MLRFCNLMFQTAVSTCRSFNPPYFRLLACVKCSVFHLQQSQWVLVYTCLQMAFSLQHGFWSTQNTPASISVSTVTCKKCLLNDKPLKGSKLILKRHNQWRNSKLGGSWSSSQVRLTTSEIIWNLGLLTACGHIHENILLDKFLFFICMDISCTKHETNCLKWYY